MTLRKKAFLIIVSTFLGLIVIMFFVSQNILLNDFIKLEERNTRWSVEGALSSFSNELSSLETTTVDWASWDDTYAFVEDANVEYIRANLVDDTFTHLGLNLMMFINSSGQTVFAKAFDLVNEEEIPVPQSLQKYLCNNDLLLTHTDVESLTTGIILLPEYPMLITSAPILTSKDEGPIHGTLIMGYYLDATVIERLAKETKMSLTMYRFADLQAPPDFEVVCSSLSKETPILIRPLSEQTIAGYSLIMDIYGKPSLVLRVDMPRDIYQQGIMSIACIMLLGIGFSLVFGTVTMLLLEKQVLSRLSHLIKSILNIATSGDISERLPVTGEDELSTLGSTINGMLASLQESEDRLREFYNKEKEMRQELEAEINRRVEYTRILVHELKTPITPVLAASELLLEEVKEGPWRGLVEAIDQGASNLNRRIDELLDLARGEIGMLHLNVQAIDPAPLLQEVVSSAMLVASRNGQSISLGMPSSLPTVRADEERLRQVVMNLVNNALKFTPEGGQITLSARDDGANLIVEVHDTGRGMSVEEQQRLFEPYYRLESDRERFSGLGLGLALSKRLVELHGGQIWVESQKGKGSTFGFSVPLEAASQRKEGAESGETS